MPRDFVFKNKKALSDAKNAGIVLFSLWKPMRDNDMRKKKMDDMKAHQERKEKAKLTREELGSALLAGVRAEQLDLGPGDRSTPASRLQRMRSILGANKAIKENLEHKYVGDDTNRELEVPSRWQKLLDPDFSVDDLRAVMNEDYDPMELAPLPTSKQVLDAESDRLRKEFWTATYEDEDTMRLVQRGFERGVEAAFLHVGPGADIAGLRSKLLKDCRNVIVFLMQNFKESLSKFAELTPYELVDRITLYFIECDLTKKFYTVPGMAFYIGFTKSDEMFEYIKSSEGSVNAFVIQRAVTFIESERVTDMLYGGGLMAGHKLDLAHNFGYRGENCVKKDTPDIVVNNDNRQITMENTPPKPQTMEEWQSWYMNEQDRKKAEVEALRQKAIEGVVVPPNP